MMEARKRGTSRETIDDYDVEAVGGGGSEQVSTPYSGMMMEPATTTATSTATATAKTTHTTDSTSLAREDSHIRSLTKGLTWRFVASGTTIIIAKIVTGETAIAFQIGFIEFFAKIGIYYIHERIWAKVKL